MKFLVNIVSFMVRRRFTDEKSPIYSDVNGAIAGAGTGCCLGLGGGCL